MLPTSMARSAISGAPHVRAGESRLGRRDIGDDVRRVVAPGIGVAQVPADPVGAGHQIRRVPHALVDDDQRVADADR